MKSVYLSLGVLLLLTAAAVGAQADSIPKLDLAAFAVAVAPPGPTVVIEGNPGIFTIMVTNTEVADGDNEDIVIRRIPRIPGLVPVDHPDERKPIMLNRGRPVGGTCAVGLVLAPGAGCTIEYAFRTNPPDGHPDDDIGFFMTPKVTVAAYERDEGVVTTGLGSLGGLVVVGVADTPEPSSAALIVTGLLGLAALKRRSSP